MLIFFTGLFNRCNFIFPLTDDAILSASPAVCALQLATAPSDSAVNTATTAAATAAAVERRPPRAVLGGRQVRDQLFRSVTR